MSENIDYRRVIAPDDFVNRWDTEMSDEEYFSLDCFINSSSAKKGLESMALFESNFFRGETVEDTNAMMIGRRVHMALFEQEKFKKNIVVMPDYGDMRSSKNREKRDDFILSMPKGAVIVTQDDLDQITGIANAILRHPEGLALIKDGHTEIVGFARCPITGLALKVKMDFLSFDFERLTDLKTTKSSKKSKFMRDVFGDEYRYDFQLAFYIYVTKLINGKAPNLCAHLCAEKKDPYEPAAYYYTEFELQRAHDDVLRVLKAIRECIDTGVWPFRQQNIERGEVPVYIKNEANKIDEGEDYNE